MKGVTIKEAALLAAPLIVFLYLSAPSLTPELEVRKNLLATGHPVIALTARIQKMDVYDPDYGQLYNVDEVELSAIYVKRTGLGWRHTSSGTGP